VHPPTVGFVLVPPGERSSTVGVPVKGSPPAAHTPSPPARGSLVLRSLEDFEVIDSEVVRDAIEVDVRSLRRPACFDCGSLDVTHYDTTPRRIRDRACGYPVVLRWAQRRFRCADCGAVTRERHPEVAGRRRITQRFRRLLFEQACNEPFVDVAAAERVSSYRVEECFEAFAAAETVARSPAPPRVLSIDESSFRKPLQFHSVLSDPERGVVLDLVEGRGKGAVFRWSRRPGEEDGFH
jgi:transposase